MRSLLAALLCLAICGLAIDLTGRVSAYTVEENLAFAEKIFGYLNNNYECVLPTIEQIDELQTSIAELKAGRHQITLSDDFRLAQRSILADWDAFRKLWESPVINRSSKRRNFLCKIEDYQTAKYGSSVCTRVKDIRGPLTDHIFERNPLVRYLKHLQTGEVIERPPEPPTTTTTTTTTTTSAPSFVEIITETEAPEELESSIAETVTEAPEVEIIQAGDEEQQEEVTSESTTEAAAAIVPDEEIEDGGRTTINEELAKEESQMNDVKHNFIGEFTIEFDEMPRKIEITIERLDANRDSLDDIPVPSSDDKEHAEEEVKEEEEETTEEATTVQEEPLTTVLPMFDEFGAEYIEASEDDASLDKLVRVPKKDWAFDQIYGYFKWPDECNEESCPANIRLEDDMLSTHGIWAEFSDDPYAYDEKLENLRRATTTTTTPKPKINAAWLRNQKKNLMHEMGEETRRNQLFGWDSTNVPLELKPFEPVMPEVKRDRWLKLADNNYCKIGFNHGRMFDSTKQGFKAVKSLFKGHGGPETNSRKRLLSRNSE